MVSPSGSRNNPKESPEMNKTAKDSEISPVSGNCGTISGYIRLTRWQLRGKPPRKRVKNKHSAGQQRDHAQDSVAEPLSLMRKEALDDVESPISLTRSSR